MIDRTMNSAIRAAMLLGICFLLMTGSSMIGCTARNDGIAREFDRSDALESADVQDDQPDLLPSYDPETLDALMGELAYAATPEEADALIGKRGDRDDSGVDVESHWLLSFGVFLTGTYGYADDGSPTATYTTTYLHLRGMMEKTDLSGWDLPSWEEGEAKLTRGVGLRYEDLVELLGGVQGLKETVSTTGDVTYLWYDDSESASTDESDGYLKAEFGADGFCKVVVGRHLAPALDDVVSA